MLPLKIVIMSATLNVKELLSNKQLFPSPVNVINIRTKTYPVNVYYNKESPDDLYEDITKKICKIHQFLPKGGILVFLPGKKEIHKLMSILEQKLPDISSREYLKKPETDNQENKKKETKTKQKEKEEAEEEENFDINEAPEYNPEELNFETSDGPSLYEIQSQNKITYSLLPLYSKLDSKHQSKIFEISPNRRSIVIATNVAETSLTIPGLKYLIDSGLEKIKLIHPSSQATVYKVQYISQASALQRQGRVGRTNIGHCYRVYTPGVYDKMREFREPEIRRVSLNHMILQLLMINVKDLFKFPYITRPKSRDLVNSLKGLVELGAVQLNKTSKVKKRFELTKLGETLSHVPLEPLHAKMILQFRQKNLFVAGVFIVCSLIFENPFDLDKLKREIFNEEEEEGDQEGESRRLKDKQKKLKLTMLDKYKDFISHVSDVSTNANLLYFLVSKILRRFVEIKNKKNKVDLEEKKEIKITEKQIKNLTNNFSLIICNSNSFINKIINEFCKEFWLTQKIIIESCKFTLQIIKLFLSLETDTNKKENLLNKLINYSKIKKKEQNDISEIILQSLPKKIAFKKTLIIEEKKVTKVFDEDNNEIRIQNSSLIKRNSSFYLYSLKNKINDKLIISGLTKVLSPALLLLYCPEYTELKINLKSFSGLIGKNNNFVPKVKVDAVFGKGRWESNGLIIDMNEFDRIYEKNRKRIEIMEELKRVDNLIEPEPESDEEYDEQGLLKTKDEDEIEIEEELNL
jgi:HrpA-like RNA helicase